MFTVFNHFIKFGFIVTIVIFSSSVFAANLAQDAQVQKFIQSMVSKHGFDKKKLETLFAQVQIKQKILDAISRPAEKSKPWHEYRNIFLKPKRIKQGARFWQKHKDVIAYAHQVYGVAPEIIVAIIGVETFYGRLQGNYRVMDALSTLGFKYPKRSKFFLGELELFLVMSREQGFDPLSKKGSYAGAMGMGQFIPSSFQSYAIDFDGDGQKDIWSNKADAIGSVANYFKRHGWKKDQPVTDPVQLSKNTSLTPEDACKRSCKPKLTVREWTQKGVSGKLSTTANSKAILLALQQQTGMEYWLGYNNFYVISRYNHSTLYSMAVYQLSQEIKQAYITLNTRKVNQTALNKAISNTQSSGK